METRPARTFRRAGKRECGESCRPRVLSGRECAVQCTATRVVAGVAKQPAYTGPPMRVVLSRFRAASRWVAVRTSVAALVALALGVFGSWWLVMGALMLATSGASEEFRSSLLVTVVLGLLPLVWTAMVLARVAVGLRRHLRFRELLTLARHIPSFEAADVARELQLEPMDAELLVLDAAAAGLVEDAPRGATSSSAARVTANTATLVGGQRRTAEPLAGREDLTGAVLNGTWRIEGHLRSGGMGAVYRATHVRTGKRYAVKMLHSDERLTESSIRRFAREARAASALGHPGIVSILDFDVALDGTHFLVMELLEGETLEDRLARDGSLPWREALSLTAEIGAALEVAHRAGILHRDLKPANVFLADDPRRTQTAVLLDFGLARPIDTVDASRLTSTGMVLGTPAYMSPEQARGEELDARSDVHALGAMLYEMVTGEPPFLDQTLAGIYAKLLMGDPPTASDVAEAPLPAGLDALIQRALAKDREQRFGSVDDLLAAAAGIAKDVSS